MTTPRILPYPSRGTVYTRVIRHEMQPTLLSVFPPRNFVMLMQQNIYRRMAQNRAVFGQDVQTSPMPALILRRQKNSCNRPVCLCDNPDDSAIGECVPAQQSEAVLQRELVLCDVFVQLAPIATPVPAQELGWLLVVASECLRCARCCHQLAKRKLSVSTFGCLHLR
jgi:hypothetical protein